MDGHLMNGKAQQLESHLRREMEELTQVLRRQFPVIGGALFTPKRDNSTQGYIAGCRVSKIKRVQSHFTRPHSMDTDDSFQSQIEQDHHDWETNYRRDYIDGDRYSLLESMCEMFDDKEKAWDDIRRRERMEQACYD